MRRVFREQEEGIGDVCEAWNQSLRRSPEKVREKEDVELVRCASRGYVQLVASGIPRLRLQAFKRGFLGLAKTKLVTLREINQITTHSFSFKLNVFGRKEAK
jgi:hypothetical protein